MLCLCHGDDNDDGNDDDVTHMRLFLRALYSDCSLQSLDGPGRLFVLCVQLLNLLLGFSPVSRVQ